MQTTVIDSVSLQHVTKSYLQRHGEAVRAVDDLSLAISTGQVVGLLGANGAGKTTTIKLLCGLVEPGAGRIMLNGYDVAKQRSRAMRQIGVVLEGTRNIYWRLSAWQNLLYFGRLKGCWGASLQARAERLLTELGLWVRRHDPVSRFSRGMQQKVAIAAALVADPPILALDEPTLGLDVEAAHTVKVWVQQLAQQERKTILLTTHQLDLAEALCERVVILHQGRVVADQPTTALLDLFRADYYEIRFEDPSSQATKLLDNYPFEGLTSTAQNGHSLLRGPIADQTQLHRLFNVLYEQDLALISVQRATPKLEDAFVQLTKTTAEVARE